MSPSTLRPGPTSTGCARDPQLAMRRNGTAAGEMAQACATNGTALIAVSTNEVFDGLRTDGRPYGAADLPSPANAYGAAKLAGERLAREAFWATGDDFAAAALMPPAVRSNTVPPLAIVRTAWLFGPPGADFPAKILAAADRARAKNETLDLGLRRVRLPDLCRGPGGGDHEHGEFVARRAETPWAEFIT